VAFVVMTHPDVEGSGTASERAFHLVYAPKGWRLADAQPLIAVATATADVPMPQKNDKTEEWRAYARHLGMPAEQAASMSRDELVDYYTPDQNQES
jgi:hypothetical protein